jgi:energy-converting hydrogenase Eha subunit G
MFLGFHCLVRLLAAVMCVAALMLAMALPASAQTPGADAKMIAAQQAFEALPEPLRKAIQFDLTFVGGFTGGASGGFGALTYLAIQNFKRAARLEGDAVLSWRWKQARRVRR